MNASELAQIAELVTPETPVIGITTYLEQAQTGVWDVRAAFLPKVYIDGVTDAGGIAVLLPPQPVTSGSARRILAGLDGLIVSGGADVDPRRYGQLPHPKTGAPRVDRDDWEDALLRAAIDIELPFLGICRGAQILNVALGGTLIQHLPDVVGTEEYQPAPGEFGTMEVTVEPSSVLDGLLKQEGKPLPVHVSHHQAVDSIADRLTVTARTADGVVQAVELEGAGFGVAVQWHPEESEEDRRLFTGLVEAARNYRSERESQCNGRATP